MSELTTVSEAVEIAVTCPYVSKVIPLTYVRAVADKSPTLDVSACAIVGAVDVPPTTIEESAAVTDNTAVEPVASLSQPVELSVLMNTASTVVE